MALKHQHFYFTGDGRTSGTEQGGSGLGDALTLGINIVSNIAVCLRNASWQAGSTTYGGAACSTYNVLVPGLSGDSNIKDVAINIDTTNYVIEAPLTYTTSAGTTQLYILYSYGSANKYSIQYHLNEDNAGWIYIGSSSSRSLPVGLSFIYIPPTASNANKFKISSTASTAMTTLPYYNTLNVKYSWHILTENDFIALFLNGSDWSGNYTQFKGYCYGPMLSELLDDDDIAASYAYKNYMAFSFGESSNAEYTKNSNNGGFYGHPFSYFDPCSPGRTQFLQFYDSNGNLIVCNGRRTEHNYLGENISLFQDNTYVLSAKNFFKIRNAVKATTKVEDLDYSKIVVGGRVSAYSTSTEYLDGQARVSSTNCIKGILNPNYFVSIGSTNIGGDTHDPTPIGLSFKENTYRHMGAGLCIGWDASSNIFANQSSDNSMNTANAG